MRRIETFVKSVLPVLCFLCSVKLAAQDSLTYRLNGAWICSAIRIDNSLATSEYTEGPYRWIYPGTHWLFNDQKICEVDYPCCMVEISEFATVKEILTIKGVKGRRDEAFSMRFQGDSLILTNELVYGASYYFIRDTVSINALAEFSTGYINPLCLYGDWEIPTGEVSVAFDAIMVWYPWKMKEQIHVDAKNRNRYWVNDRFYLEVDGVKRPFRIKKVSMKERDMILVPEEWVNDYIKKQKLDHYQVSDVWLRRISN